MVTRVLVILTLFWCAGVPAAKLCEELPGKIGKERKELEDMIRDSHALNEKFTESVKRDFHAQSEGMIEDIHRNEAVKVAFARKKLHKAIEKKRAAVAALKSEYCAKCFIKEVEAQKKVACEFCPEDGRCRRSPAAK